MPAHQLDILRRMHVPVESAAPPPTEETADVVLDGIIGYSLKG